MWRLLAYLACLLIFAGSGLAQAQPSAWPADKVRVSGVPSADDLQELLDEGAVAGAREAADCSALADGRANELCRETADDSLWWCPTAAAPCSGAEWLPVGGASGSIPLDTNCTNDAAILGQKCIDSGGPDKWSLWVCSVASCDGVTPGQWQRVDPVVYTVTGDPNDPGPAQGGECPAGTGGRCDCPNGPLDRAAQIVGNQYAVEYVCTSAATDIWFEAQANSAFLQSSTAQDPNDVGGGTPAPCFTAWIDRFLSETDNVEWVCVDADADTWEQISQAIPADALALRPNETAAQYYIPAFGSGDANDVVVSKCTFSASLDAISCDQGASGQQVEVMEAAPGTDSVSLGAPTTLAASQAWIAGSAGRFPEDMLEGGARRCVTGGATNQLTVLFEPFDRNVTVRAAVLGCTPTGAGTNDVSDCASNGATIARCTPGTNNDIPGDCTTIATLNGASEFSPVTTFTAQNGGTASSGDWIYASVTDSPSAEAHTLCVYFETD